LAEILDLDDAETAIGAPGNVIIGGDADDGTEVPFEFVAVTVNV
jgi:hypothetical protein